jgi:HK97 family phage major capsid protein
MDTKALNTRKQELLKEQQRMLQNSIESKVAFTESDNTQFENMTKELDSIALSISRAESIKKGLDEIGVTNASAVVTTTSTAKKFYAMGGYKNATVLPSDKVNDTYVKNFWASLKDQASFQRFQIENAVLGELGTSAAGGALVPIATDPSIPALAIEETTARSLSRVIETETDLNLQYQTVKTLAALKAESNSTGTNSFAENDPAFATTKLTAYTLGGKVTASWELLRDAKAASQFITEDLQRAIRVKEENLFVNGSGSSQPQGYLGNGTTATGASITGGAATLGINPIIDTMGSLNKAYYNNAKWLVARPEFNRLLKAQIAANQYQTFVTFDPDGNARLFGYEVAFSAEMPVYSASPSTTGSWMFGDFNRFATIGDRGGSNIYVKVLDQVSAQSGQTVILGYRYCDQRILIQEAVVQLNTNG